MKSAPPQRWAAIGSAIRDKCVHQTLSIIEAVNEDEAAGKALRVCRKQMPEAGGWRSHQVAVLSIDANLVTIDDIEPLE